MNKRLQELAEQAGDKIPEFHFGDWNHSNEFLEKFAELIVGDCFQYLEDEIKRLSEYKTILEKEPAKNADFIADADICIDKCLDIAHGLKEHFGGKE